MPDHGAVTQDFDVERIRRDFPILQQVVHGARPLVYLDSAATSQKPRAVIDALANYYLHDNANVHRGIYQLAERATAGYEAARARTAELIDAPDPNTIVFTKNASESINLVAYAWGRANLQPGDVIVASPIEHHSNLIPWQELARTTGAELRYFAMNEDGSFDEAQLARVIEGRTKFVAVTHASNVLGTLAPLERIIAAARAVGAKVLVDAAQSVPHQVVSVRALDCDFLAFSGHKMLGPTGIGVLYGKAELLEAMPPFLFGGEMISRVTLERADWKEAPYKFEAGTPNIAGAIGLGAAVDYLQAIGLDRIHAYEERLVAYARAQLEAQGVQVYGPKRRAGLLSFNVAGVHPHDLATLLDREGVAIRAGHHCAQPVMQWLDVPATARASFYLYNTPAEVDALVAALIKAKEFFAHVDG